MLPAPTEIIRSHSQPLDPIPTGYPSHLPALPGIRAVVFDVYGTLFVSGSGDIGASSDDHHDFALQETLREFSVAVPCSDPPLATRLDAEIRASHAEARTRGIDYPEVEIRELWQKLLPGTTGPLLEAVAISYECHINPVWPMPGALDLIRSLKSRCHSLGIVSNAQFYTPLLFEAFFASNLPTLGFSEDLCLFSYEHRRAKPGRWLYEQLRSRLAAHSLVPEQVLYVGNDALKDIHPAAAVGFRTALFAGDRRSLRLREDHPNLNAPDAVIVTLEEVLEII